MFVSFDVGSADLVMIAIINDLLKIIILFWMPDKKNQNNKNYNKYDDWICLMCQNHNYSFRTICNSITYLGNRCHQQTKEYNTYLILLQQGLIAPPVPSELN